MPTNRIAQHLARQPLKGTGLIVTTRRKDRGRRFIQSMRFAVEGLREAWQTEPNLRIHSVVGACLVALGFWCRLVPFEWLWVAFSIGVVIFAELMNTAIEQTVDLIIGLRPDPVARRIKDVAAASVLIAALLGAAIQCLIFLPHFSRW